MYTVTNENIATVCDTSHHLTPSPLRWIGLRSAAIDWKNSETSTPGISRTIEVSTNASGRVGGGTVED